MVIRAILRNIQNTLVLSSALLVILALQRLQHYEFRTDNYLFEEQSHHGLQQQFQQQHQHQHQHQQLQQPQDDLEEHESLDNFRLGMNHPLRFEAPFRVGLFQFTFPTLERIGLSDKASTSTRTSTTAARRQDWEIAEVQTLVHYLVDLSGHHDDCHLLDAAAVFAHSLRTKNALHAIVNETMLANCNASSWLSRFGYNVIPSESISLLGGCSELWQAYALQNLTHVDVVVRVPATTVARHDNPSAIPNTKKLKLTASTSSSQGTTIRKRRRAMSSSTYSSLQSIQLLRPKSAKAAHKNECQSTSPTVCQSSSSSSPSPSSPCQIVRHTALLVPSRKCALPWTCPNSTALMGVSSCRVYHDLWRAQRREMMVMMMMTTTTMTKTTNMMNDTNVVDVCANGEYQSIRQGK